MLRYVYVFNAYFDYVADGEKLGGVFYVFIAHGADVQKTVVVNADVNEAAKVNYVTNGTL